MAISEFVFDKTQGKLQWESGNRTVQIPAAGLDQAQADTLHDRVLALQASGHGLPTRLRVFAANGEALSELPPPEDFQFYYLTEYPKLGVAVVCVMTERNDGFTDWYFGLDSTSSKLVKHGPAY